MSKAWSGQGQKGSHGSGERVWARIIPNPKLKLLDQCREVMRLKHYSIRTERCYCDWIRRYIHFHKMRLREEMSQEPKAKIELFLSDLAVNGQVLGIAVDGVEAVRADRPVRVPVVMTTARPFSRWRMARRRMYGSASSS